ncbi:uncharacterized protein H6S33_011098 [Morchella sextelata]|uniref:uncharacterized protein n=1 Tax=Morchella sextelata TaxID=1174677 RepID=UPI001D055C1A|nr:uncharacterized protein H6S33_011098 [Morchella sextelata]KAH0611833.1 hypothetical protein H6S33_011098 [Morchella sextelata]
MRDDVKALMALLARQHRDITVLVEEICVLSQVVQEANGILRIGGHSQEFFEDVITLRARFGDMPTRKNKNDSTDW